MKVFRAVILVIVLFGMRVGFAQTSFGNLTGEVRDPQKAVVTGANVAVTNLETNVVQHIVTNGSGAYSAASLQPGFYRVTVTKSGFEQSVVDGVNVETASSVTVNFDLKLGGATTVVQVYASSDMLTPDSATLTATVGKEVVLGLPFPERSALSVATLIPGVQGDPQYPGGIQSENPGIFTQPVTPGASLSISGGRPGSSSQLVDGFDITLSGFPRAGVTFSPDAIHSVTVQQNGLGAQYGRTGGGIVNQSTQSGTVRFHGNFGWRHEDPFFMQAYTPGVTSPPDVHQNIFTASIGGPLPLPSLKSSHTFFFAAVEPLRGSGKQYSLRRATTPDELAGRLHNSLDLLDGGILKSQGYAAALAAPRVGHIGYQFALNAQGFPTGAQLSKPKTGGYPLVPNDDLSAQLAQNPVATLVNSLQPSTSNQFIHFITPDGNTYNQAGQNASTVRAVSNTDNRYTIRVDHEFGESDRLFVRYTTVPVSGLRYDYFGPTSIADSIARQSVNSQNGALDYTHIFKSARVNELRASYLRSDQLVTPPPQDLGKDYGASLGLTPAVRGAGFPSFALGNGLLTVGQGGGDGRSLNVNFGFGDDFSMLVGSHSIKFGGEYRALQLNRYSQSQSYGGSYGFNRTTTNDGTSGGSNLAAFYLGLLSSYSISGEQPFYYRWKYAAAYIQDDWKALPNLTLNIGLRYNIETPRQEKYNLQGTFVNSIAGTANGIAATGAFAFSGQNGLSTTLWPINYHGVEPRLGFAFQPRSFMTMRGSYTLVHTPLSGLTNSVVPDLVSPSLTIGATKGGVNPNAYLNYITNPVSLPATLPGVLKNGPLFTYVGSTGSSGSTTVGELPNVDQSNKVPYVQMWSASLQFQIGQRTSVEASYAGQHGVHLFSPPTDTNVPSLNTLISKIQAGADFNASTPNAYGLGNLSLISTLRPYQQFATNVIESAFDRNASSSYNGLYLRAQHSVSSNLRVLGGFSWSKSLDNASSGSLDNTVTDVYGYAYPQLPYSLDGEYSLSTFNLPVNSNVAYVWNLPVGRGKKFLGTNNRLLEAIVGGWQTSGRLSANSGYPIRVFLGDSGYFASTANLGVSAIQNANLRPNIVPGQPLIKSNWKDDPFGANGGGYLNPKAFTTPGSIGNPQIGNAARTLGDARSPRTINFDMSMRKSFGLINDRVQLQLRGDAINALNHANYFFGTTSTNHNLYTGLSATGTQSSNVAFGNITSAGQARIVAVGAYVSF